jgi:NADPH:quinone reductase-like Zn-dependent oxidoreductase
MKVDNDEVWNDVKAGKVKGFSIEGYFADKLEMSLEQNKRNEIIEQLKNLLNEQILKHQVKQVQEQVAKEAAYVKTKHTQPSVVMEVYKLKA